MFKKILIGTLVLIVVAAGATAFYQATVAAGGSNPLQINQAQNGQTVTNGQGNGYRGGQTDQSTVVDPVIAADDTVTAGDTSAAGQGVQQHQQSYLPTAVPGSLDEAEIAGLIYMREEEKLAGDVYTAMYEIWGAQVFQNIASSESMHAASVKTLLDAYGIADPAQAQAGVFTNPELQALYNQLVQQGSLSLADAFKVGGAIEELDILDLRQRIAQTDNADLIQVYNNLLQGSSSHLSAFANSLLSQTGETYQPQYMTLEDYQAVLSATSGRYGQTGETGQGSNSGGGNGYHGGRNNP